MNVRSQFSKQILEIAYISRRMMVGKIVKPIHSFFKGQKGYFLLEDQPSLYWEAGRLQISSDILEIKIRMFYQAR
jgi:hypothetical protein